MTHVSKDLVILQALTAHLQGVTPANGYDHDLSDAVFRGRVRFGDGDPLPMISILEAPRTEQPVSFVGALQQRRTDQWSILVQGWSTDDKANPTDTAYALKAEVEDRLGQLTAQSPETGLETFPDVYLLGRLVLNLQIGPGIVSPPREGISNKAFFFLPLVILRTYDPADVFST